MNMDGLLSSNVHFWNCAGNWLLFWQEDIWFRLGWETAGWFRRPIYGRGGGGGGWFLGQ